MDFKKQILTLGTATGMALSSISPVIAEESTGIKFPISCEKEENRKSIDDFVSNNDKLSLKNQMNNISSVECVPNTSGTAGDRFISNVNEKLGLSKGIHDLSVCGPITIRNNSTCEDPIYSTRIRIDEENTSFVHKGDEKKYNDLFVDGFSLTYLLDNKFVSTLPATTNLTVNNTTNLSVGLLPEKKAAKNQVVGDGAFNTDYILTTGTGNTEFSTYPSLYSEIVNSEGKYSSSRGNGFSNKEYTFAEASRFSTDIEGMALTVFERANSILPENNIVAVTDAAYLQNLTGAKGNLEALVNGSEVFNKNVKLSCDENNTSCISLEDFANGVSYSAVHDRVGSDIANYHMDNVGKDSKESGYATTLRNGKLVNIILPGDDWILQQSTAYTGRMLNGELHDNLANIAENCISGYDVEETFGAFDAKTTINCVYSGINKEIGTRNILGGNK